MKTLKTLMAAIMLAATLPGQATNAYAQDWRKDAEGREVDCLLQVKGKTYLKGTCMYDADQDGSFRLFGDKYFVYLNMLEKGVASASWNESPKSSHAQAPLGEDFKQDGACWVGKRAKICATDKADKKEGKDESQKDVDQKDAAQQDTGQKDAAQKDAGQPSRIKFDKGASTAVVTGKLADFDGEQTYLIEVGKGQTMTVEQLNKYSNGQISIYVTDPQGGDANDLDASCHGKATVTPTMAGDYKIQVMECKKADPWKGKFAFKVTVK